MLVGVLEEPTPPSTVLGVDYEHLGVRGQVNVSPMVGEVVWTAWQAFLNQPGINMAALHPAMPTVEERWKLVGRARRAAVAGGQGGGDRVEAGGRGREMQWAI